MLYNLSVIRVHDRSEELSLLQSYEAFRFLLCLSGEGRIVINHVSYPTAKGKLLMVKNHVDFRFIAWDQPSEYYVISAPYDMLWTLSDEGMNLVKIFETSGPILELSEEEQQELIELIARFNAVHNPTGVILERNIRACEILLGLLRLCNKDHAHDEASPQTSLEKVLPALNYIHTHYMEPIVLDDICNDIFISKYYLCRLFKEATGITIQKYISSYRIRQSCIFLQNRCSVQEAGERVGFDNNSSYIRTFKRVMSITPGQYIRMHS